MGARGKKAGLQLGMWIGSPGFLVKSGGRAHPESSPSSQGESRGRSAPGSEEASAAWLLRVQDGG